MRPGPCERVLLVGFMGSGKTSVGRALARRLGWRYVDFDDEIAEAAGASIPEIFSRHGESHFRQLEAEVARRLLTDSGVVLGSGGGWGAVPGRLTNLPSGTESFWLQVSPATAVRRASAQPGGRPLLDRGDALEEASRLLAERAPSYGAAKWAVDTEDSTVEDVAARLLDILRREHPKIVSE